MLTSLLARLFYTSLGQKLLALNLQNWIIWWHSLIHPRAGIFCTADTGLQKEFPGGECVSFSMLHLYDLIFSKTKKDHCAYQCVPAPLFVFLCGCVCVYICINLHIKTWQINSLCARLLPRSTPSIWLNVQWEGPPGMSTIPESA